MRRFIPQSPAARAAIGLVVGFLLGLAIAASGSTAARSFADWLDAIGTMWVNAIRMTVIPLVVALLVATIVRDRDLGAVGRMSRRALLIFVIMLAVIASIGLFVAPPLLARVQVDPASAAALRAAAGGVSVQMPTFAEWLVSLVPANPVKAATDGAILPLIIFALLLALGLSRTAPDVRTPSLEFFGAVADAMVIIVKWVLALAPFGVFALAVPLAIRVGAGVAGAAALFVALHCGMLARRDRALLSGGGTPGTRADSTLCARGAAGAARRVQHAIVRRGAACAHRRRRARAVGSAAHRELRDSIRRVARARQHGRVVDCIGRVSRQALRRAAVLRAARAAWRHVDPDELQRARNSRAPGCSSLLRRTWPSGFRSRESEFSSRSTRSPTSSRRR